MCPGGQPPEGRASILNEGTGAASERTGGKKGYPQRAKLRWRGI